MKKKFIYLTSLKNFLIRFYKIPLPIINEYFNSFRTIDDFVTILILPRLDSFRNQWRKLIQYAGNRVKDNNIQIQIPRLHLEKYQSKYVKQTSHFKLSLIFRVEQPHTNFFYLSLSIARKIV
ncbi:hypothetical protein pb186bvf_009936 [Paramecium bursaria]